MTSQLDTPTRLQRDEWLVARRYLSAESIALVLSQTVQTERSLSLEKITEEVTDLPAAA